MGTGLVESVYQYCIVKELRNTQVKVDTMKPVMLHYKGEPLNKEHVIDVLVEDEIIIELKAVGTILRVHESQVISSLKLAYKRLRFLINFNVPLSKQSFKRFVNNF